MLNKFNLKENLIQTILRIYQMCLVGGRLWEKIPKLIKSVFDDRLRLDYYIINWLLWLNLYIW